MNFKKIGLCLAPFAMVGLMACGDDSSSSTGASGDDEIESSADESGSSSSSIAGSSDSKTASSSSAAVGSSDSKTASSSSAVAGSSDSKTASSSSAASGSSDSKTASSSSAASGSSDSKTASSSSAAAASSESKGASSSSGKADGKSSSSTKTESSSSEAETCGGKTFDATKQFCAADVLYDLCAGEKYDVGSYFCGVDASGKQVKTALCGGESYKITEKFCLDDVVTDLCGGEDYTSDQFCASNKVYDKCNGGTYDVTKYFCYTDATDETEVTQVLVGFCGGKAYNYKGKYGTILDQDAEYCDDNGTVALEGETLTAEHPDGKIVGIVYLAEDSYTYLKSDNTSVGFEGVSVKDGDGNFYSAKKIGSRIWMTSNLKTNLSSGSMAADEDHPEYGNLYTYSGAKNGCPSGWHLPSRLVLENLETTVKSDANAASFISKESYFYLLMDETWANAVNPTAIDATKRNFNATGFSALPSGYTNSDGDLVSGSAFNMWSSYPTYIYNISVATDGSVKAGFTTGSSTVNDEKTYRAVRCVMDYTPVAVNL